MKYLVETGKIMDVVTPDEMAHGFANQRREIDAIIRQELEGVKIIHAFWTANASPYVYTVSEGFVLSVIFISSNCLFTGADNGNGSIRVVADWGAGQIPGGFPFGTMINYLQPSPGNPQVDTYPKGAFLVRAGESLVLTSDNQDANSPASMGPIGGFWTGILLPAEKLAQLYV